MRVAGTILQNLISQTGCSLHGVRGWRGQIVGSWWGLQNGSKFQIECEVGLWRVFVLRSSLTVMMSDFVGEIDGKPQAPSFADDHVLKRFEDSLKRYAQAEDLGAVHRCRGCEEAAISLPGSKGDSHTIVAD